MARLTPRFSANRTVREYTELHYLPAAAAYRERAAGKGAEGGRIVNWLRDLEKEWESLSFGAVKVETKDGQHVFEVQVHLGDLDPDAVQAELFVEGAQDGESVLQEMKDLGQTEGDAANRVFGAQVPASRPASDYTARLIPRCQGLAVPLEAPKILWQR